MMGDFVGEEEIVLSSGGELEKQRFGRIVFKFYKKKCNSMKSSGGESDFEVCGNDVDVITITGEEALRWR